MEESNVSHSLFHTTLVPAILESGIKDIVISTDAVAIVNCWNMSEDPQSAVMDVMKKRITDDRVFISPIGGNRDATPFADINGTAFKKVEEVAMKVMLEVIPVPFLLMTGTDSRNSNVLSRGVIKCIAILDLKREYAIVEHLTLEDMNRMIFFYSQLIRHSGK